MGNPRIAPSWRDSHFRRWFQDPSQYGRHWLTGGSTCDSGIQAGCLGLDSWALSLVPGIAAGMEGEGGPKVTWADYPQPGSGSGQSEPGTEKPPVADLHRIQSGTQGSVR